jgi:Flp pilus assembly protein TadD
MIMARSDTRLTRLRLASSSALAAILLLLGARSFPQASPQPEVPKASSEKVSAPLSDARLLLEHGKLNEAEDGVRQYLKQHPDSAEGHFLLGYIFFREIQANAAKEGKEGTHYEEHKTSSESNSREARAKESLAEFTEGAKHHDPSAFDLKIVALDYVFLHDFMDADKWLTKSLAGDPKDTEGWYYLGRTKYNENRFEEAISAFEQCLKLDPENVKAEDNLGLAYAGLGRTAEATAAYRNAITWQEHQVIKDFGPYLDLGTLLLEQNQVVEAVPYLRQAVEIAPAESRTHEQLGRAYSQLDQLPQAQDELESAVRLASEVARLHFILGQVYRKEGLAEKAKLEFARYAELSRIHASQNSPDH